MESDWCWSASHSISSFNEAKRHLTPSQGQSNRIQRNGLLLFRSSIQIFKGRISDPEVRIVVIVEVPPLKAVYRKSLALHRLAQQVAVPAFDRSAAWIERIRALRHLVIPAGHADWLACFQVVKRQINSAAAVMARSLARIGNKDLLIVGRTIPEHFGDVP